jgi:sugar (pentulose or hexulose) kinase
VAQRLLAAALGAPVAVGETAGEGGSWGMALLAAYLSAAPEQDLGSFLNVRVFANAALVVTEPDPADMAGFSSYLDRYSAGLAIERAATEAI